MMKRLARSLFFAHGQDERNVDAVVVVVSSKKSEIVVAFNVGRCICARVRLCLRVRAARSKHGRLARTESFLGAGVGQRQSMALVSLSLSPRTRPANAGGRNNDRRRIYISGRRAAWRRLAVAHIVFVRCQLYLLRPTAARALAWAFMRAPLTFQIWRKR